VSIFRERKTSTDRSAADRARHKKKIEKAIKESIRDVVAEESIIGQDGKKKIRIPIKGIKEYQFVYGDNKKNKQVGSAQGRDIGRGQRIGRRNRTQPGAGQRPGDRAGEEIYEIELPLEELAEYLFSDLELPELEKKNFKFVTDKKMKRKGKRPRGIRPRLSKKETLKQKIRRKKTAAKVGTYDPEKEERFSFHESDLRYKHISPTKKENTSAVIFFLMDVSGSMDKDKKFLARSFYFLLYQFLNHKYTNTEVVFVSHTTEAKEVNEEQFFTRAPNGGTKMSSALEVEKEIISKRYHPSNWNIYTFYCGDGENWPQDNPLTLDLLSELRKINQMMCYTEIGSSKLDRHSLMFGDLSGRTLWDEMARYEGTDFKRIRLLEHKNIWPAFGKLFGGGKA